MRSRLLFLTGFSLLLLAFAGIVLAQEAAPPPYAGLQNPFPWDDTAAQEAGKLAYQQSCLGCHGINGNGIKDFDFSQEAYAANLEKTPDYYFWIFSDGRLDKGMPSYKSSFSEEKRWQTLTYIWSLGKDREAPPAPPPPVTPPPAETGGRIILVIPQEARAGQPISFEAAVRDRQDQPVPGVNVKFFIQSDFFAQGTLEIGEAASDEQGIALLEYVFRQAGDVEIITRYEDTEDRGTIHLLAASMPLYETEVGLHFPRIAGEQIIGPESARELGPMGQAPTSGLRVLGGTLLPFLMLPLSVAGIWYAYFRVVQIVSGIPVRGVRGVDTRIIPFVLLGVIAAMGLLLLLMLITGPDTHFHLM